MYQLLCWGATREKQGVPYMYHPLHTLPCTGASVFTAATQRHQVDTLAFFSRSGFLCAFSSVLTGLVQLYSSVVEKMTVYTDQQRIRASPQ